MITNTGDDARKVNDKVDCSTNGNLLEMFWSIFTEKQIQTSHIIFKIRSNNLIITRTKIRTNNQNYRASQKMKSR